MASRGCATEAAGTSAGAGATFACKGGSACREHEQAASAARTSVSVVDTHHADLLEENLLLREQIARLAEGHADVPTDVPPPLLPAKAHGEEDKEPVTAPKEGTPVTPTQTADSDAAAAEAGAFGSEWSEGTRQGIINVERGFHSKSKSDTKRWCERCGTLRRHIFKDVENDDGNSASTAETSAADGENDNDFVGLSMADQEDNEAPREAAIRDDEGTA